MAEAARELSRRARHAGFCAAVAAAVASGVAAQTPGAEPVEIIDFAIPRPLTDRPGDPARGKRVLTDAGNATCLICHAMPIPEEPDHGNLAPDLAGVGSRYTAAELRLRIVDPKVLNPDTIMPAYYRSAGFYRVQEEYRGTSVYSAQDVEDVIAYLLTLTEE